VNTVHVETETRGLESGYRLDIEDGGIERNDGEEWLAVMCDVELAVSLSDPRLEQVEYASQVGVLHERLRVACAQPIFAAVE
jgi:hypothetical protein